MAHHNSTTAQRDTPRETEEITSRFHLPRNPTTLAKVVFYPLFIMAMINSGFIYPHIATNIPKDFRTIYDAAQSYVNGAAIYTGNPAADAVPYLYSPGATFLISPLGLIQNSLLAENILIILNIVGIIGSVLIIFSLLHISLKSAYLPVVLFLVFITEAVQSTLAFGNINGILLLGTTGFTYLLIRMRTLSTNILAGVLLGVLVCIKPLFLPLAILLCFRKYWIGLLAFPATFLTINAIGWASTKDANDYIYNVVPYLGVARDYANSSFPGLGTWFDWNQTVVLLLQGLTVVIVGIITVLLVSWIDSDRPFWAVTSVTSILIGVFLVANLGQGYYSLFIIPLLIMVLYPRHTVAYSPFIWVAAFLCLYPGEWSIGPSGFTLGWSIILISVLVSVLLMYSRKSR